MSHHKRQELQWSCESMDERMDSLEAERDRLKAELEHHKLDLVHIDDSHGCKPCFEKLIADCDQWKAKAEKLADFIKQATYDDLSTLKEAEEVLAAYASLAGEGKE